MTVLAFSHACPQWITDAREETQRCIAAFTPDQLTNYGQDSKSKVMRYWCEVQTDDPGLWKKIQQNPTLITQKELVDIYKKDSKLARNLVILGVYHDALNALRAEPTASVPAVKTVGLSLVHPVPR